MHEPKICCIAKGKAGEKYGFGNKASVATTSQGGWLLGALSLPDNPYDGHTLDQQLAQVRRLVGGKSRPAPETHVDMGYRGHNHSGPETVHVDKRRRGATPKTLWRWMKRRAAVEPTIGHLKGEHRLERNRLKGATGDAINAMLWQVSKNCPTWGGVCVDDKGLYWETLAPMLRQLGREQDLILLQVRPADAPSGWKPAHTFNFLDDPHLPYSAKAKIVCDVATSLGQRSNQSFFRMQAQMQMEFAFQVLAISGLSVTLENAYGLLTSDAVLKDVMEMLSKQDTPAAKLLLEHYEGAFRSQPAEQLGGVKTTVANYLKYFTDPGIAEVFCAPKSSFSFDDLDRGKIICVSIPQRYQIERRYINTLLKLSFYAHALRRFDKPAAARATDNLLILWADEAQKIVTLPTTA